MVAVASSLRNSCTNPISIKVGTLSKNAIICNLLIHLNLYLTDKKDKENIVFFLLIIFNK